MDFLLPFLTERWYVVVIALLVVLWVVRKIVKAALKWVLVLAVVAVVVFYGANYRDRLVKLGRNVGTSVAAEVKDEAMKALRNEFEDARYEGGAGGKFVVSSRSVKLEGKTGAREATLTFRGRSVQIRMDDALRTLVEEIRARR